MKFLQRFNWEKYDAARKTGKTGEGAKSAFGHPSRQSATEGYKKYLEASSHASYTSQKAHDSTGNANRVGGAWAHRNAQQAHRDAQVAHATASRMATTAGNTVDAANHAALAEAHRKSVFSHQGSARIHEGKSEYHSTEQEKIIKSIGKPVDKKEMTERAMKQLGESEHFKGATRNFAHEYLAGGDGTHGSAKPSKKAMDDTAQRVGIGSSSKRGSGGPKDNGTPSAATYKPQGAAGRYPRGNTPKR
jgi:hypothetical protein